MKIDLRCRPGTAGDSDGEDFVRGRLGVRSVVVTAIKMMFEGENPPMVACSTCSVAD
ncbi:MAG: hypothetical protein ACREH8_11005 [Opitutaceae bacterium]